jgi:hypothetical protein
MLAVTWSRGVEDAWTNVAEFVPKLFGFLLILIIGYFIAKALSKLADGVLERVKFDAAVERGGIGKALSKSDMDASDIVSKFVFYGLMLIVLQMAFGVFGSNPVSDMLTSVVAYIPKVIAAIIIVVLAAAIAAAVKELISASLGGLSYGKTLANVAGIAIVTVGAFAALNQLQIAPAIVNGLFYAVLAIIAGSAIISIGFGGVEPMRTRWEKALARYDEEKPKVQQQLQAARAGAATSPRTAPPSPGATSTRPGPPRP